MEAAAASHGQAFIPPRPLPSGNIRVVPPSHFPRNGRHRILRQLPPVPPIPRRRPTIPILPTQIMEVAKVIRPVEANPIPVMDPMEATEIAEAATEDIRMV